MRGKQFYSFCFLTMFAAAVSAQDTAPANTENEAEVKIIQVQPDAKTFSVRRGFAEVISAEISKQKPVFADENRQDISPFGENSAWAQLILELPAGRGFSRFDFTLEWNGQTCPCMAVAPEDTPYSMMRENWSIAKLQQPGKIRAVFAMPADAVTGSNVTGPVLLVRKIGGKSALPPDQIFLRPAETFSTAAAAAEALKAKPQEEAKIIEIKEDKAEQAQKEEQNAKTVETEAVKEIEKKAQPVVSEKTAPPAEPAKTPDTAAPAPAPAKTEVPAPAQSAPAIQLNFSL